MVNDMPGVYVYCCECGNLVPEDDISETTREYIRNSFRNNPRAIGNVYVPCRKCRLRYFDELAKEMKHDD